VQPLKDVRVVTMALNAPGPVAASKMRDAGATVVKIEPPTGDPLETYVPGWYHELHAGITIERVDLKSAAGGRRIRSLLADADLFLASQRPSALARLGLDADTLLHAHSRLNHLRWLNIVGELGAPEIPGHDLTYLAAPKYPGRYSLTFSRRNTPSPPLCCCSVSRKEHGPRSACTTASHLSSPR
jgi:alpha-methylacyl-CoA racemase